MSQSSHFIRVRSLHLDNQEGEFCLRWHRRVQDGNLETVDEFFDNVRKTYRISNKDSLFLVSYTSKKLGGPRAPDSLPTIYSVNTTYDIVNSGGYNTLVLLWLRDYESYETHHRHFRYFLGYDGPSSSITSHEKLKRLADSDEEEEEVSHEFSEEVKDAEEEVMRQKEQGTMHGRKRRRLR